MRFAATFAIALALATAGRAAGTDEISVSFVSLDGGSVVTSDVLDVGAISRRITRRVGIRMESAVGGTAMLRVWLESPDSRCHVRMDGIELGAMPRVIAASTTIGTTVPHRIEIIVPADAPEGAISSSIAWEVIRN
ncbi:MAG TPA: hypothetical protein VMU84_17580 [Thermoanaerobaculia bacterium]|nr:hypothetical protein [Thermoanaerobaculia bacterium]